VGKGREGKERENGKEEIGVKEQIVSGFRTSTLSPASAICYKQPIK
jgi:hypothetical protein